MAEKGKKSSNVDSGENEENWVNTVRIYRKIVILIAPDSILKTKIKNTEKQSSDSFLGNT